MADDTSFPLGIDTAAAEKNVDRLLKKVEAFGKGATQSVNSAASRFTDSFGKMGKSVSNLESGINSLNSKLNLAAGIAAAVVGLRELGQAFGGAIDAAREKEDALSAVRFAMARTGEFSETAADRVQEFADALQDATGVGDDTALSLFALAKNFGVTNEAAEKMVKAAVQLSAATGKPLEATLEALGKSLDGTAGKLEETVPGMRALSEESLKAGAALDLVLDSFGGTAEAKLETFSGAVLKSAGAFDDLQTRMGEIITKNTAVIEIIKGAGAVFKTLEGIIGDNSEALKGFIGEFALGFLKQLPPIIQGIGLLTEGLDDLASGLNVRDFFNTLATAIGLVTDEILLLARGFQELKLFAQAPIAVFKAGTLDELKELEPQLAGIINSIQEIDRRRDKNVDTVATTTGASAAAPAAEPSKADTAADRLAALINGVIGRIETKIDKAKEPGGTLSPTPPTPVTPPKTGPAVQQVPGFGGALGDVDVTLGDIGDSIGTHFGNQVEKAGVSFIKNIGAGEAGANKFVAGIAGGIATAIGGPVVGEAVAGLFELLGQDPATFGKMIDGFVKGIPRIIDNIVENIPTLVIAIAENTGPIITALVNATPRIVVALAQAMPIVAEELAKQLAGGISFQSEKLIESGETFKEFVSTAAADLGEFFAGIPESISGFFEMFSVDFAKSLLSGVEDTVVAFYNGIVDSVDALIEPLANFFNSLTGGSGDNDTSTGGFEEATGVNVPGLKFANGADFNVPPGFVNDSFGPMFAQSGERVRVDTAAQQANGGGDGGAALALLARILAAVERGSSSAVSVAINEDGLSKAILKLNYSNARLAR